MNHPRNPSGFTLIELMIVVAILGILIAIAIPQFQRFVIKTKRTEAVLMLKGIATAETGYFATYDSYLAGPANVSMPLLGLGTISLKYYQFLPQGIFGCSDPVFVSCASVSPCYAYMVFVQENLDQDATIDQILIQQDEASCPSFFSGPPYFFQNGVPYVLVDDINT